MSGRPIRSDWRLFVHAGSVRGPMLIQPTSVGQRRELRVYGMTGVKIFFGIMACTPLFTSTNSVMCRSMATLQSM